MSEMFSVTFLGTSAGMPTPFRNVSATLVRYRDIAALIDCGEGTQRQIMHAGTGFRHLRHILMSHEHLDHTLGLPGLLATWHALRLGHDSLTVYGNAAVVRQVEFFSELTGAVGIRIVPQTVGPVFAHHALACRSFLTNHRVPDTFGFIFEEEARRPFLPDAAAALGVPSGPDRGRLMRGEDVSLADGRTIRSEDVLGPARPGRKLVYISDSRFDRRLIEASRDATVLICEATFLNKDSQRAAETGHMTARQAAQIAAEAGVQRLYLNHVSPRYQEDESAIVREAQEVFPRTELAQDLMSIEV